MECEKRTSTTKRTANVSAKSAKAGENRDADLRKGGGMWVTRRHPSRATPGAMPRENELSSGNYITRAGLGITAALFPIRKLRSHPAHS